MLCKTYSHSPALTIQRPIPRSLSTVANEKLSQHLHFFVYILHFKLRNYYRVPHYFCTGVCAVCSVAPTHQVSTVSGRTTIPTVALVPASSLVQCAERTSWRRSCCCSVSTAIGGCCSLGLHMHTPGIETKAFMRTQLKTSGGWIIYVFFMS